MNEAAQAINTKTKQDYMVQGATKAGMVAAGTALGAAVGSIIPASERCSVRRSVQARAAWHR
jgi:hypothetical protein